jgi:hypothetical protein
MERMGFSIERTPVWFLDHNSKFRVLLLHSHKLVRKFQITTHTQINNWERSNAEDYGYRTH